MTSYARATHDVECDAGYGTAAPCSEVLEDVELEEVEDHGWLIIPEGLRDIPVLNGAMPFQADAHLCPRHR